MEPSAFQPWSLTYLVVVDAVHFALAVASLTVVTAANALESAPAHRTDSAIVLIVFFIMVSFRKYAKKRVITPFFNKFVTKVNKIICKVNVFCKF